MRDITKLSVSELLSLHASILNDLRKRGIVRSANNPVGDLAEHIFCLCFGWEQAANSVKSYDATDSNGTRYQIKARRLLEHNASRQLSAIRDANGFDTLAALLFDENYSIVRAALIPTSVVQEESKYVAQTNSYRFMLRDSIWDKPNVIDVTKPITATANTL